MSATNGHAKDPASKIPGAPPNFGRATVPHVVTFPDQIHQLANVYRNPDAAVLASKYNARSMRADLSIMAPLKARQRAVSLLDVSVVPEDKKDQKQKEAAKRLTSIVNRTYHFLRMRFWLMQGIWFGRAATNNVWQWDQVNGQKAITLKNWIPVHGDKLVFKHDGTVGIRMAPQGEGMLIQVGSQQRSLEMANDYGMAYFLQPWERSLMTLHQHEIEDADYEEGRQAGAVYGIGIRSQIYQTWVLKQETLGALVDFIDRVGQGFTVAFYEDGNPQSKAEVQRIANEYDGRSWILFPKPRGDDKDVYDVKRIEPSAAGIDALRVLIDEYFGTQIMHFILGQTATMRAESAGLGGENEAHQKSFYHVVKFDAANLAETLTTDMLDPLKDWNCPEMRSVNFRVDLNLDSPQVKDQLDSIKAAWEMGAKIPARQVCDLLGINEPGEDEEVLQNPQMAQGMLGEEQARGRSQGAVPGDVVAESEEQLANALGVDMEVTQEGSEVIDYATNEPVERYARNTLEVERYVAPVLGSIREQLGRLVQPAAPNLSINVNQGGVQVREELPGPVRNAREAVLRRMPEESQQWAREIPLRVRGDVVSLDPETLQLTVPQGLEPAALQGAIAHGYGLATTSLVNPEAWQAAWEAEMAQGQVTRYAKSSPLEGAAEFARLAWSDPEEARAHRQCYAAFEEAKLVPKEPVPQQIIFAPVIQPASTQAPVFSPNILPAPVSVQAAAAPVVDLKPTFVVPQAPAPVVNFEPRIDVQVPEAKQEKRPPRKVQIREAADGSVTGWIEDAKE